MIKSYYDLVILILELKETRDSHCEQIILNCLYSQLSYISLWCLSKMTSSYLQSMHVRQYHSYRKNSLTKTRFLFSDWLTERGSDWLIFKRPMPTFNRMQQSKDFFQMKQR